MSKDFHHFDPAVERLAMERFLSGKQIFDYRTHRLKSFVRDELQGRAILVEAEAIAKEHGKKLLLRYYERKLLNGPFEQSEGSE